MLSVLVASVGIASALGSPVVEYAGEIKLQGDFPDVVHSPLPSDTIKVEDLPEAWDWRGKGVMTTDLNQHIPV